MKKVMFLSLLLVASQSWASTLKIACGENGYDALDKDKPNLADVYIELTLRGANNPPEKFSITAAGVTDFNEKNTAVTLKLDGGSYKLRADRQRQPYDIVEGYVKDCGDLDASTGSITVKKAGGGFAGGPSSTYKCVCKK